MSNLNSNGTFNHQKWQRTINEGPGDDPMLKSLRTRIPGEKFPELKTWWEYQPEDIMTYVYWHQGQLPPTGTQFDKEWINIVKQLHSKHPIPADVLPSVDLDRDAMDAIMQDAPRAESVDRATMTEALARGLKPLLMIGSTIKSNVGEDALVKLSDKFEDIDDEQADDIASHLNMAIELMQDRSPSEARGWLKKFNIASKDALSGKSVKSAFENINEAPMDQNFQKEWETSCSALINHIKFEQSKNDRTNHRELSKLLNMVQDAQSVPEKLSKIASKEFPGQ